jgi:hypothetical protein
MSKFYLTGALFASALAIAGCNKAATTNNTAAPAASNTAAPAAPAAPAGGNETAAAPAEGQQNFTITNTTGHTVVTLKVSASNENSWGPDILGRDTLANGESAQITFPHGETQCNFDIQATYDDGDTTDARGVNLCQVATVTLTAH